MAANGRMAVELSRLLKLFERLLPGDAAWRAAWWETPRRLFEFERSAWRR
jgi:hypothetical protein